MRLDIDEKRKRTELQMTLKQRCWFGVIQTEKEKRTQEDGETAPQLPAMI